MTSISKRKSLFISILTGCLLMGWPLSGLAQSSLSLSVSPTLFEMSASRGQIWQSSIKVINSNAFPITVYAEAVNFAPQGEAGQGKLIPVLDGTPDDSTLAQWISLQQPQLEVPPESSREIPFVVTVPENAPPGGHFAAIMVGTEPPANDANRVQLRTSQVVTSLFFLRIAGDVLEAGDVRSFTVGDALVEEPTATFELRFENKGNVHLQPQGSIDIYNMWGAKRGSIPINHQTNFGNVLPDSIRKFVFTWRGEPSFADIGRYRAEVALGYGTEARHFSTAATHFWVIPIKAGLITLAILGVFGWIVFLSIRAYVRRMLVLAGVTPDVLECRRRRGLADVDDVALTSYRRMSAPVRTGWFDLRDRLGQAGRWREKSLALVAFGLAYRRFFIGLAGLLLVGLGLYWYLAEATSPDRVYEVTIDTPGAEVTLNSEEIALQQLLENSQSSAPAVHQPFQLELRNTSGVPGIAATVALKLLQAEYAVDALRAEPNRRDQRTVIVFDTGYEDEALAVSKLLGGALLSASGASSTATSTMVVYVGADQVLP